MITLKITVLENKIQALSDKYSRTFKALEI